MTVMSAAIFHGATLVAIGTALLGAVAGLVGVFLLLRRRALLGDALGHATLPGIALAFLVMVGLGGSGRWLPGLLLGAAATGLLGVACVSLLTRSGRIRDDTAMAVVLGVFFGLGVALLGIVQRVPQAGPAGLESLIYGRAASMLREDLLWIAALATVVGLFVVALRRDLTVLCFDESFARTAGRRTIRLDLVLLALVTVATVIGLQVVGLILVVALLVIPAAAARFWTDHLGRMLVTSAMIGSAGAVAGALLSASHADLPTGAVIVLVLALGYVISAVAGPACGLLARRRSGRLAARAMGSPVP